MADVTALGKRPCPDCGGELEWNAGKAALACPYCGFVPRDQPGAGGPGVGVEERDLEAALLDPGGEGGGARGYGGPATKVKCQSCHAISVFEATRVAQRCDFCGSPAIVPYQESRDPIAPESLLPAQLGESRVRELLRAWYGSHWLAPDALKSGALTDTLHGVYLPYWTFDARVSARWTAESGEYYYVTVPARDAQGRSVTRRERRVRWRPSSGREAHFFDDVLVAGTVGVRGDLLRRVEPFPTSALVPYDPAFVRGWTVERYQVDLRRAAVTSQAAMDAEMRRRCAAAVPGDTHRNLRVDAEYSGRTFKHVLFPVWVVTYTFGARTYQAVVNGSTGVVAGDRPLSWVKVFFFIILPLSVVAVVVLAVAALQR